MGMRVYRRQDRYVILTVFKKVKIVEKIAQTVDCSLLIDGVACILQTIGSQVSNPGGARLKSSVGIPLSADMSADSRRPNREPRKVEPVKTKPATVARPKVSSACHPVRMYREEPTGKQQQTDHFLIIIMSRSQFLKMTFKTNY